MAAPSDRPDQFDATIVYADADSGWARLLAADLARHGLNVSVESSPSPIEAGARLEATAQLVLLWSEHARDSTWVQSELGAWRRRRSPQDPIAVVLEGMISELGRMQQIAAVRDARAYDAGPDAVPTEVWTRVVDAVVAAVRREPSYAQSHAPASSAGAGRRKTAKQAAAPAAQEAAAEPASAPAALPEFARLSTSSQRALQHAHAMARAMGQDRVHMEHLILALYEKDNGPTQRELHRAGIGQSVLRERLAQIAEAALPQFGSYETTPLAALPPHSAHVAEALAHANAIAASAAQLQSRHLLYGVLSVSRCRAVQWLLDEFGVSRDHIDLGPVSAATDSTIPLDDELPASPRAQVDADVATGEDLLQLEDEVEAICAVLAAKDMKPPLSIGLFGDWGTGKSFFMNLMRDRIRDMRDAARANRESAYCTHIVQLSFNAWHYMDTDLWASLAAEIFEGLARELESDQNGTGNVDQTRARLLATTSHLRDVKAQAEQRKADADTALHESEQRLTQLVDEERRIAARLAPREVARAAFRFAAAQPAAAKPLENAARKLGIPDARALASDTRTTLLEIRDRFADLRMVGVALRQGSARVWLSMLLLFGAFVLAGWLVTRFNAQLAPLALAVSTVLGSVIAFVKKVLVPVRAALGDIEEARAATAKLVSRKQQERVQELEAAHAAVQSRVSAEETAISRIAEELAALERQLEALRADRAVEDFIQATNAGSDYRRHFGVIARARKDFGQLEDLLRRVEEEEAKHRANPEVIPPPVPRIDRIILYIDDLDRCPENKVVDVLQAVHLLLALRLFVVVVAVDSRWLLHSLRQHARVFQVADDELEDIDEEDRVHWQSTPFNYLEKIFQIPFNLQPMPKEGFDRLISTLTAPASDGGSAKRNRRTEREITAAAAAEAESGVTPPPPPDVVPQEADAGAPPEPVPDRAVAAATSGAGATASGAAHDMSLATTPAVASKRPVHPNPPFLQLTDGERAWMQCMYRLIPTPRAAKRYVNVYRLLRGSVPPKLRRQLADEHGAHYRSVLLMLALLTGYPQEGAIVLRELVQRNPKEPWWTFLAALADEYTAPAASADAGGKQRVQRWADLKVRMNGVQSDLAKSGVSAPETSDFTSWARYVARYSFESGRVLGA